VHFIYFFISPISLFANDKRQELQDPGTKSRRQRPFTNRALHLNIFAMEARHKKELKAFEGEKRSALKKIKGTAGKGKKGKEALAA